MIIGKKYFILTFFIDSEVLKFEISNSKKTNFAFKIIGLSIKILKKFKNAKTTFAEQFNQFR